MSYTDTEKMGLARAWAEWAQDNPDVYSGASDRARAAADVVASLPEVIVDGDKLREVIDMLGRELVRRDDLLLSDSDIDHNIGFTDALHWATARLESLLPTHYPAHECAADVLYSVIHEGAVRTAWRVDNDDTPWIVSVGHPLGTTWAADNAVRVLGPAVPDDGVVDRPVVSDDADDLTDLREARADDNGARVTLEQVAEANPAYIYTDSDGDEWEYIDGRWVNGETPDERADKRRFGFGRDNLPEVYGPYTRTEQVAEVDPAYIYTDRDGSEWECIDGRWFVGGTPGDRRALLGFAAGHDNLPEEYGPYTRIEEKTNDQ